MQDIVVPEAFIIERLEHPFPFFRFHRPFWASFWRHWKQWRWACICEKIFAFLMPHCYQPAIRCLGLPHIYVCTYTHIQKYMERIKPAEWTSHLQMAAILLRRHLGKIFTVVRQPDNLLQQCARELQSEKFIKKIFNNQLICSPDRWLCVICVRGGSGKAAGSGSWPLSCSVFARSRSQVSVKHGWRTNRTRRTRRTPWSATL